VLPADLVRTILYSGPYFLPHGYFPPQSGEGEGGVCFPNLESPYLLRLGQDLLTHGERLSPKPVLAPRLLAQLLPLLPLPKAYKPGDGSKGR
jgi:hypothetical protein